MKKTLLIALVAFVMGSCSSNKEENLAPNPNIAAELVPKAARDKIIFDYLKTKGEFDWSWVNNQTLFSALTDGNNGSMTVGYMPKGFKDINTKMHEVDVKSNAWVDAKEQLIADVQAVYQKYGITKTRKELVLREHKVLPFFKIEASIIQVVDVVRASANVRYAEPSTYNFTIPGQASHRITSSSGCGSETSGSIPSADSFRDSDNALVSWHLEKNKVNQAWPVSSKGRGINIGMIDTGISSAQSKLGSAFNSGYSNVGRTVEHHGTFAPSVWFWQTPKIDGPYDDCGHGTSMSAVMAGPRTTDGSPSGVAYEANLYAVRGTNDVMLNSGDEQDGVSDALVLLANKNTHIISMSLGNLWSVGQIADAVRYAYGKGKLIFSAAGTSFSWANNIVGVIFPATMSEINAVTGVTDRSGYKECHNCHYGSKVDFVLVMQRDSDDSRTGLTLQMSGNSPNQVGGSSVATATMAGIAALVWSGNPSQLRATVLQRLKESTEYYPSRSSSFGWGKVDAYKAVMSVQ